MATTTIDRVINQYELLDRYSDKLERMSRHTESFGRKVEMAKRAAVSFSVTAAGALAAGVLSLGVAAVKASAQFEQFNVTLEVLTGGADKAAKKLDFIKKLAIPSTFTFQELAEAGTQLESFRVPLEKALPLIAKLGAAFPNKELGDFVNLFGRLASGDFPDLEALSGAGLSKLDFMKQGIKFDAQGSLLSSARDTMNALERIINQRYGTILDRIAGTTNAKLATVRDKWEEVLRKIGDALLKFVIPALDKLSNALDKLTKSDEFERFLKNLAKELLKFAGGMIGVVGTLMMVMGLIDMASGNFLAGGLRIAAGFAVMAAGGIAIMKLAHQIAGLTMGGREGHFADKDRFPGVFGPNVPETPAGMEFPDNPALKTLNDIEGNTRMTADNTRMQLDLRRYGLGGGNIAAEGIQAIDRYGGMRRGGNGNLNITAGRDKLGQAMSEIARDVYEQMMLRQNGGR